MVGPSAFLGSSDDPVVTLKAWAAPADFVSTVTARFGGTSDTAGYVPPYNTTPDATQKCWIVELQGLSGVRLPVETANDFVITHS